MVGLCSRLNSLVAFGTDGEKALGDAFHAQFPNAKHLLCFIHVKNRIKIKLRDLGIPVDISKGFIVDIFGEQHGTHKLCGLVDCESPEQFDLELEQLEEVWNGREMYARSSTEAQFHSWFLQYQACSMKEKMLKPLRQALGLGHIPSEYTNNPNESTNARIKDYKKSELSVFCNKMKELVDSQTQDIESAFTLDSGPYAVSTAYWKYKENPRKWVSQSKAYKQRALNSIHKLELLPRSLLSSEQASCSANTSTVQCDDVHVSNDVSHTKEKENLIPLSVSCKEAGLSEQVYGGMWQKAACLVGDSKAITDAPCLPDSKMVASYTTPQQPHVVDIMAKGKISCNCLNYTTKSLCSHVLAVAEKSSILPELLVWFKATNQGPNLWSLARSVDAPKHPGAKLSGRKRSRSSNPKAETCSKSKPYYASSTQSLSAQQLSNVTVPQHYPGEPLQPYPPISWPYISGSSFFGPSQISCSPSPYSGPTQWSYNNFYCNPAQSMSGPYCPPQFSPPRYQVPMDNQPPRYQIPVDIQPSRYQVPMDTCSFQRLPHCTNPFTFKFMTNRISKCQGCKETLQLLDNSLPLPPNDLILSRAENRPFVAPDGSTKIPTKPSVYHYHFKKDCIEATGVKFDPCMFVMPDDVKERLTIQHVSMLSSHGVTVSLGEVC